VIYTLIHSIYASRPRRIGNVNRNGTSDIQMQILQSQRARICYMYGIMDVRYK